MSRGTMLTEARADSSARRATYAAPDALGGPAIRYFASAVGDHNPLYTDGRTPARTATPASCAPTLISETNQFVDHPRDPEGFAGHGWDIEAPGTRLVRGGNNYVFHQPVSPDDVVTVVLGDHGLAERTTPPGRLMLVVTSTARFRQRARRAAGRERGDVDRPRHRRRTMSGAPGSAPRRRR